MAFLILVAFVGFLAYRATSPEERERFFATAIRVRDEVKTVAKTPRPENDAFHAALRERMPRVLVTPALAFVMTAVFGGMLVGTGPIGNADTLLAWGASLGTRTTNGEWWRLLTATFVHTGFLHLLVNLAVLYQLGSILERLVGRPTFAAAFVSAGTFDTLVSLSLRPVAVTVGISGAIFGLYGLLAATLIWQKFHGWRAEPGAEGDTPGSRAIVYPRIALKRIALVGVPFFAYSAVSGHASAAEFVGLLVGMMSGAWLARRTGEKPATMPALAHAGLAIVAIGLVSAIRIGHITDVKPELARVLELEKTTVGVYQAELDALKKGRMPAEAVARLAEETIPSELKAADARLEALPNVPPEHKQVIADAREYVRLRTDSWRARGVAIRRIYTVPPRRPDTADDTTWRRALQAQYIADNAARGHADSAERDSLQALQRIASFLTASPGLKTGPTS